MIVVMTLIEFVLSGLNKTFIDQSFMKSENSRV